MTIANNLHKNFTFTIEKEEGGVIHSFPEYTCDQERASTEHFMVIEANTRMSCFLSVAVTLRNQTQFRRWQYSSYTSSNINSERVHTGH